jgi:hypothetical protein
MLAEVLNVLSSMKKRDLNLMGMKAWISLREKYMRSTSKRGGDDLDSIFLDIRLK